MRGPLLYRAGASARERLRDHGLTSESLRVFVLPATGPRWLVMTGIDLALIQHGWFSPQARRLLLLGASAGAWRALALSSRDPSSVYRALIERYCAQHFTTADSPASISAAYADLIARVFADEDLRHALDHPSLDLGLIAARCLHANAARSKPARWLALIGAALANAIEPRTLEYFFERVLFHTGRVDPDSHAILAASKGSHVRLTPENARSVALATGTVPLYMDPVRGIPGAPGGAYVDGALTDYHLNRRTADTGGIVLLLTHAPRLVGSWLDQFVPWSRSALGPHSDLLLCCPSREFVRSLPGGVIPSRADFERFVDRPEERWKRWGQVVDRSGELGAAFLEDVRSGAIASRVEPLER